MELMESVYESETINAGMYLKENIYNHLIGKSLNQGSASNRIPIGSAATYNLLVLSGAKD